MIEVLDALVSSLETVRQSSAFQNVLPMDTEVKLGDPGIVMATEYPYICVAPINDAPKSETMGRAGYDVRWLTVQVLVVVDQSTYFDPDNNEVAGLREFVEASTIIRKELRKLSSRGLGGLSRNVAVTSTEYTPQMRGDAYVAVATTTLIVERQYQHEE